MMGPRIPATTHSGAPGRSTTLASFAAAGILLAVVWSWSVSPSSASAPPSASLPADASLVVTTSMLASAVGELIDDGDTLQVVQLIPPNGCPGHFDLSPRTLPVLRSAALVVRHDYQAVLEHKLSQAGVADAAVVSVATSDSLLIPENYLALVRGVAATLASRLPDRTANLDRALARVEARMSRLESEIRDRQGAWLNGRVIASARQARFCAWLGLDVIAEIDRPEDLSPRRLRDLLDADPTLVVGNLQEGTQAATTLAERLSRPLVVFSNFPNAEGFGHGYDELVRHNLDRLSASWPPT